LGSSIDERVAAMFLTMWGGILRARVAGVKPTSEYVMSTLLETENEVASIISRYETQARTIAAALIEVTPSKVEGERLRALIHDIEAPRAGSGKAEARRLRQMHKIAGAQP